MNWRFVLIPLPMVFLLSYTFVNFQHLGDFQFHASYEGGGQYPSGVASILNLLAAIMPRAWGLHLYTLLVAVILPYILVFHLTKNELASWIYIYGSNIPTVLYYIWFVPQATIQLFMLLSLAWTPFFAIFLLTGWIFHNSWAFAFILTAAYALARKYKLLPGAA